MVAVRSETIDSVAPCGSAFCSSGSWARTSSTVETILAPGWRWTSISTAGPPLYQAPFSVFSRSCTAAPTSASRTGPPLRQAMISRAKSAGSFSWSFAMTEDAWRGPSTLPFGVLTLAAAMAVRTSSSERP